VTAPAAWSTAESVPFDGGLATERVSALPFASAHGSGTVAAPLKGTAATTFEQAGRLAAPGPV
jgi:hypothetical protein